MTPQDEPRAPGLFELSGGALCLDFANTWGNHADRGSDGLREYGHVLAFARQTGSLDEGAAAGMSRVAAENPEAAGAALSFALELRRAVYRVFSAGAAGGDFPIDDVERINDVLGIALSNRRLERRGDGFEWGWLRVRGEDLRAPLWPVVESAALLMTSDDLDRVRECGGEDCNWLFIDRSRSKSRRWCSMQSCGNRAKARRYYRRQREA